MTSGTHSVPSRGYVGTVYRDAVDVLGMAARRLKTLGTVLVAFVLRDLPPEGLVMLMEPPPGTGRVPPDVAADQARQLAQAQEQAARPSGPTRRRRLRRTTTPVTRGRTPPTRRG